MVGYGNGFGSDDRVLRFLAQLVKGQAVIARGLGDLRHEFKTLRRGLDDLRGEMARTREEHGRAIRMLMKVAVDTHRDVVGLKKDVAVLKTDVAVLKTDVAGLKSDVSDLKVRMTGVERRLGRNGSPRSGKNGSNGSPSAG